MAIGEGEVVAFGAEFLLRCLFVMIAGLQSVWQEAWIDSV